MRLPGNMRNHFPMNTKRNLAALAVTLLVLFAQSATAIEPRTEHTYQLEEGESPLDDPFVAAHVAAGHGGR